MMVRGLRHMPTRDTKSVILDTAGHLFNQRGSQNVSTNRIAAEMSISVGNLYYHFNNKEDIIRSLYDRMTIDMDELWSGLVTPTIPLEEMLERLIQQMWEYRFFQREQLALMNNDPLLLKKNHEVRKRKREKLETFMSGLVSADILRQPLDEATIPVLASVIWIISENWLAFLELEGKNVSRKNVRAGTRLILQVIKPYLSPEAITEISE